MDEQKTIQREDIELVGAYDERTRLFNAFRNPNMTDEQRAETKKQYAAACKRFDDLRAKFIK